MEDLRACEQKVNLTSIVGERETTPTKHVADAPNSNKFPLTNLFTSTFHEFHNTSLCLPSSCMHGWSHKAPHPIDYLIARGLVIEQDFVRKLALNYCEFRSGL